MDYSLNFLFLGPRAPGDWSVAEAPDDAALDCITPRGVILVLFQGGWRTAQHVGFFRERFSFDPGLTAHHPSPFDLKSYSASPGIAKILLFIWNHPVRRARSWLVEIVDSLSINCPVRGHAVTALFYVFSMSKQSIDVRSAQLSAFSCKVFLGS